MRVKECEFEMLANKVLLSELAEQIFNVCTINEKEFGRACKPCFFYIEKQKVVNLTHKMSNIPFRINFPYVLRHSIEKQNHKLDVNLTQLCCDHVFMFSDIRLPTAQD